MHKAISLLSLGLLAACADPAAGRPDAVTQDAPAFSGLIPAAEAAEAVTVRASGATSKLEWVGAKITGKHDGGFRDFAAEGQLAGGQLTALNGTIQLGSIYSDNEKLTGHLRSPDFFHVEQNPTATFTSTSITPGGQGGTHTITGVLDLHGQRKQIAFPAAVTATATGATVKAEFGINRKDFGIVYPGKPDDLIQDNVLVKLSLDLRP